LEVQVSCKIANRYLPYVPIETADETGLYELLFFNEEKEWPIYLGQGILKKRIDNYGHDGDAIPEGELRHVCPLVGH
jgi:hypothetical protein